MTPEQESILSYTISHFQEVARQNRFPENSAVAHDTGRCAICHAELLPLEPFAIYLDVVTQSVKVRRPRLDRSLVDQINGDLALEGRNERVLLEALLSGDEPSARLWADWIRTALETGMELLSIHSPSSLEFSLEDASENESLALLVEEKIRELMVYQRMNR